MERREFLRALGGGLEAGIDPRSVTVVEEREPAAFRNAFIAATATGGQVALANPDWGTVERAEFQRVVATASESVSSESGWLLIPTGGSTGGVKLARHDQTTIAAAVRAYGEFFDERVVQGVGVLPLHHVGGLMAWLRCVLTEGEFVDATWPAWREGRFHERLPENATVSLVPAQLRRLLHDEAGRTWLRRFRRVLIGGAAADAGLVAAATDAGVAVVPSYGMTETMAMIAACTEAEMNGLELFPHVTATVNPEGRLALAGPSLFRGYWPQSRDIESWESGDRVELGKNGSLRVLGRADAVIVTGGEKVDAGEVEALLREYFGDERVAVIGLPDERWGQIVMAAIAPDLAGQVLDVEEQLKGSLAPFKRPKAFQIVDPWPVNALGKVQRAAVRAALTKGSTADGADER